MLHQTTVALAIALVLGSTAPSRSAFARSGVSNGAGTSSVRRDDFVRNFGAAPIPNHGYDGISGLRRQYHPYGYRVVWVHWGNYYGPMIHAP